MPALLDLQGAFAAALLAEDDAAVGPHIAEDGFSAGERLSIYRNACRSTLIETLRLAYPAVQRLVGREFFDMAAARFVRTHPCASGYLNDYGAELADCLAVLEGASALPYLADVARFEGALSLAANACDAPLLGASVLAAVPARHHEALRFEPHPSLSFLLLTYPADEIADAVLSGDEAAMAQVDLETGPIRLVVNRGPDGVQAQRLDDQAYGFLSDLCAGEAWARVAQSAPLEASRLLAEALRQGFLCACRV